MKIALVQLNCHVGNFPFNTGKIVGAVEKARAGGADLVVFPELAVCGYPPLDLLDYGHFILRCEESLQEIASHASGLTVIVGAPASNPDLKGKNLFNSAWVLQNGSVITSRAKTLLPTYDVFDEYRWFESNRHFSCIEVNGVRIALTVCEDLWNMEEDPLYTSWPMDELIGSKPQLMVNIAASPFSTGHAAKRRDILRQNVLKYGLPLVYVNHVGAQADIIFDGASVVYDQHGAVVHELKSFSEDFLICEFDEASGTITGNTLAEQKSSPDPVAALHDALVMGIRDYFDKMGFTKAVLGLSGGIDSAVVLALAAAALGPSNVHVLLMPSAFSSTHSVSDSLEMAERIGCTHSVLPVAQVYDGFLSLLSDEFNGRPFDVTEENLQARIRAVLLMAVSNKSGYILLNTSNKSELAVGYGTLYGDMCGGLSVIGDVYKTTVYGLARFINLKTEVIPLSIIEKAPSAELRPGQKDSDSLPEYEVLDGILLRYIEEQKGPGQIISEGYDEEVVMKVLKMVNSNEWKRHQFAPILRVSNKAFGRGRRMPLVARYLC